MKSYVISVRYYVTDGQFDDNNAVAKDIAAIVRKLFDETSCSPGYSGHGHSFYNPINISSKEDSALLKKTKYLTAHVQHVEFTADSCLDTPVEIIKIIKTELVKDMCPLVGNSCATISVRELDTKKGSYASGYGTPYVIVGTRLPKPDEATVVKNLKEVLPLLKKSRYSKRYMTAIQKKYPSLLEQDSLTESKLF